MRGVGSSILGLVALLGSAGAVAGERPSIKELLAKPVTFDFDDASLVEALGYLRDLTTANIVIGPTCRAKDPAVTLSLQDAKLKNALSWLARTTGMHCVVVDDVVCFGSAAFVKRCKTVPAARSRNAKIDAALKRTVSFQFINTPLGDVVAFLKDYLKIGIVQVGGKPAAEKVSIQLKEVPAGVAIKYIGLSLGRAATVQGGVVGFQPPAKPKGK